MSVQKIEPTAAIAEIEKSEQVVSQNLGLAVLNELEVSLNSLLSTTAASTENRTVVGSRPLPADLKAELQQSRIDKEKEIKGHRSPMPIQILPVIDPIFDPRTHFLASFSFFDNTVELDDGSFWKVRSWDMQKIRTWASNDILTITPNKWGAYGEYSITNQATGQSVGVDLFVGPVLYGTNTHWIVGIDDWLGRVYLENGTYWDVRGLDQGVLSRWQINDTVILGHAANQWFGYQDSILINVEMNHYVYANRGV